MERNILTLSEVGNALHKAINSAKEEFINQVFSEMNIDVPKYVDDAEYRDKLTKEGLNVTDSLAGGVHYIEIEYKGRTAFCLFEIGIEGLNISVKKKEFNKVERTKK